MDKETIMYMILGATFLLFPFIGILAVIGFYKSAFAVFVLMVASFAFCADYFLVQNDNTRFD